MERHFILVLLIIFSNLSFAQKNEQISSLRNIVFDVKTIDPSNENFEDLEFLIPILEDKDIVLLGEEEHTFANTFEAKSRLIKFLHQKLGFSVIAFEFDLYSMWKINNLRMDENEYLLPIQQYLYSFWGETTATNELFHYVENLKKNKDKIEYIGFDGQIKNQFALLEDLEKVLIKNKSEILSYKNFQKFKEIFQKHYSQQMQNLSIEDFAIIAMFIDDIIFNLDLQKEKTKESLILSRALFNIKQQMINQITDKPNEDYQLGDLNPQDSVYGFLGDQKSMGIYNRRDKLMAENIAWIKNTLYPNKKIIIWGHSEHTMYNRNKIKKSFPPDFPFHLRFTYGYNFKNTGTHLKEIYGDNIYSVGFSTMNGEIDYSKNKTIQYLSEVKPAANSIEELLIHSEFKFPFLNFNDQFSEIPNSIFNENMSSNILGGTETIGNLSKFYDGILFIRNAKPIKYIEPE